MALIWRQWLVSDPTTIPAILLVLVPFLCGLTVSIAIRLVTGFDFILEKMSEITSANERMGRLESVLVDVNQFDKIYSLASSWRGVFDCKKTNHRLSSIIEWKRRQIEDDLRRVVGKFVQLASGRIEVNDPSKELTLNSELVELIAEKAIRAVSYEDANFWRSPVGKNTLQINNNFIKSGKGNRYIKRLFIEKEEDEYAGVLKDHANADITVKIIKAIHVPGFGTPDSEWDFVIYDSAAVRTGRLILDSKRSQERVGPEAKAIIISVNESDIREGLLKFDAIWELADDVRKG